jgi:hypothetical protein
MIASVALGDGSPAIALGMLMLFSQRRRRAVRTFRQRNAVGGFNLKGRQFVRRRMAA